MESVNEGFIRLPAGASLRPLWNPTPRKRKTPYKPKPPEGSPSPAAGETVMCIVRKAHNYGTAWREAGDTYEAPLEWARRVTATGHATFKACIKTTFWDNPRLKQAEADAGEAIEAALHADGPLVTVMALEAERKADCWSMSFVGELHEFRLRAAAKIASGGLARIETTLTERDVEFVQAIQAGDLYVSY